MPIALVIVHHRRAPYIPSRSEISAADTGQKLKLRICLSFRNIARLQRHTVTIAELEGVFWTLATISQSSRRDLLTLDSAHISLSWSCHHCELCSQADGDSGSTIRPEPARGLPPKSPLTLRMVIKPTPLLFQWDTARRRLLC